MERNAAAAGTVKRIGIAVVESEGRFLVGVRGPNGPLPGMAEFPGGKCRPDESPRDCAVRECREETGLAVIPVTLLQQITHTYEHGTVELHFWHGHPAEAAEIAETHQSFRWVPRVELPTLPFPAANAAVIAMLVKS